MNNHFAAHLENVARRNADFDHIYRTMNFNKPHGSAGFPFSHLLFSSFPLHYSTEYDAYNIFSLSATASDTSVQLHKAVNVCNH